MVKFLSCKSKSIPTWLFTLILVLWLTNSQAADSNANTPWQQDWSGKLQVTPDMSLTLILHITQQNDVYIATLDSVEQGAMGIPASKTTVNGKKLVIELSSIGAQFSAEKNGEKLIGTFKQGGQKFPLVLTPISTHLKQQLSKANLRPQEPKAPYSYIEEDVSYAHVTGAFKFAGTLTKPTGKGPFAAAILVSGSGPQDRDSNLMGHKPFKVLADHLTRLGYAVLRTDDRGTGKSEGTFNDTTINDFTYDVESAFNYLSQRNDIERTKIGLIGHSEGGITSPIFAARQPKVAFVIMLAGLGVSGTQLWATQQKELGELSGMKNGDEIYQLQFTAAKMAANQASFKELKTLFSTVPNINDAMINNIAKMLSSPWGHSFTAYQPAPILSKLNMPLLALNGDLDIQVNGHDNLAGIKTIMADSSNKDVTISLLPGLNHLFQKAKTGNITEYAQINETINKAALNAITIWLTERF